MAVANSKRAWVVGPLAAAALGCGGGGNAYSLPVGSDDAGGGSFLGDDAGSTGTFDAHIEENHITVTIVTLTCAGDCASVEAVATGGHPPYTFAWDDGSTSASRMVCPTSSTRYAVKVTDTGSSGELTRPAQTVQVPLTADVLACPDGGSAPGPCDRLTDSTTASGANPSGAWSYGWSQSLGATFTRHTEFIMSPQSNQATYPGIDAWTSGVEGIELNPATYVNPTAKAVAVGTTVSAQPGQVFLHPGPVGQYSIARWTAPRSGTYEVRATFEGIDTTPTTTDVHVQHNGVDIATGSINVMGGGNTFQASPLVTVVAGDAVDFAVGDGGNSYLSDSTRVDAAMCTAPADGG